MASPFSDRFFFDKDGIGHPVCHAGHGCGVLLMHELPGATPEFWRFAHWLLDEGYAVFVPDLYASSIEQETAPGLLTGFIRACISREIHLFAENNSSPVTQWLRALASDISERTNSTSIGVVGMCMTGNFALSLALNPEVKTIVASQPALPICYPLRRQRKALQLSDAEKEALKKRDDLDVLALRFKGDPTCTNARFNALANHVDEERLTLEEIDDIHQNPNGNPYPHAVLTKDLINEKGSVTLEAKNQVLRFLRDRVS